MEIRTKHFTKDGTLTPAGLRHYATTSVTLIESGYNPKDYVIVDRTASKHLVMDRRDFHDGELLLFSAYNEYVPPLKVADVTVNDQVQVNVVSTEILKQHDIQLRVGPKDAFLCGRDHAYELLVIGKIYLLKIVHREDNHEVHGDEESPVERAQREPSNRVQRELRDLNHAVLEDSPMLSNQVQREPEVTSIAPVFHPPPSDLPFVIEKTDFAIFTVSQLRHRRRECI